MAKIMIYMSKNCRLVYLCINLDNIPSLYRRESSIGCIGSVSLLIDVIIGALLRRTLSRSEPLLRMKTPMLVNAPN